jgi:hypothetical protein
MGSVLAWIRQCKDVRVMLKKKVSDIVQVLAAFGWYNPDVEIHPA